MGTRDYVRIFRRSWLIVALATVLGIVAAWCITAVTTPQYEATSAAFVSSDGGLTVGELTQGNAFTERRVNSYAKLLREPIVTQAVLDDFGLEMTPSAFAANIAVTIPVDTTMLEVTVTDATASIATSLANALVTELSAVVAEIETTAAQEGLVDAAGTPIVSTPPVKVTQVRFATLPADPVSPNLLLNLVIGLFVGLAVGALAAIGRDLIDTRVRSVSDVEALSTAPIVGAIPTAPKPRSAHLLSQDDPGNPFDESFRILRTNLQFLDVDGPSTFVITSPRSGEGKSTVTANLAVAIAANGLRVLVVEADLRRPRLHEVFGIEGGAGLTDVLIERAELEDVIQPWTSPRVHVLAAGRIPPNPSELLGSRPMRELALLLAEKYDVVLYDTPPMLPVPDAAVLSRLVGGVLLVTAIDRSSRDEIRSAVSALHRISARLSGIVANRVPQRGMQAYLADPYSSFNVGVGTDEMEDFLRTPGRITESATAPRKSPPPRAKKASSADVLS